MCTFVCAAACVTMCTCVCAIVHIYVYVSVCKCVCVCVCVNLISFYSGLLQWAAADAEIKVPSGENTELKHSPFKALSRSVYSHTCYTYCQGFIPCLFLPFWSIHLHSFQNLSRVFPVLAGLTPVSVWSRRIQDRSSCLSLQTIDAGSRVECPRNINRFQKMFCVRLGISKC